MSLKPVESWATLDDSEGCKELIERVFIACAENGSDPRDMPVGDVIELSQDQYGTFSLKLT